MAVWHPEEHPPPDTQRQRDPHFGDKLIEPVAQKGVDDEIQAPFALQRFQPFFQCGQRAFNSRRLFSKPGQLQRPRCQAPLFSDRFSDITLLALRALQ